MKVADDVDSIVSIKENRVLLTTYQGYYNDRNVYRHYWEMWEKRQVYGEIMIGTSTSDIKTIQLDKSYPDGWECVIDKHCFSDRFETTVIKDILTVKRIDFKGMWGWPHKGRMMPISVPKIVHQTWETKDLPKAMKGVVDYNMAQNPDFKFILYDHEDRIKFIETYFDPSVIKAYHTLVPGAFRADLFRYCVLYVLGGIYMDMRFKCTEGFHLTEIAMPQYIQDIAHWGKDAIYNGIIVSNSNNKTLFDCIMKIVKHCEDCFYGKNPLCITGPVLLGNYVKDELSPRIQMSVCETPNGITINKGDRQLFYTYEEYNADKSVIQPYWRTWDLREVFGEVNIGISTSDTKIIKLHKSYPEGWECVIDKHCFSDRFETTVIKDILTVKRIDFKGMWGWPHKGRIVPKPVS